MKYSIFIGNDFIETITLPFDVYVGDYVTYNFPFYFKPNVPHDSKWKIIKREYDLDTLTIDIYLE